MQNPVGLAVDANDVLVSENDADVVTAFPLDGTGLRRTFKAIAGPLGLAVHGTSRYIANGPSVLEVLVDGTTTDIDPGDGSRGVTVAPATGNVFVSTDAGTVTLTPVGGTPTTLASGLNDLHGMDFRPARFSGDMDRVGLLYAADTLGGFIFQFADDGTPTKFATGGNPNYITFEVNSPGPTPTPTPAPTPTPTPGKQVNISTRVDVETGDNVAIGGFIITGGSAPKQVVIRAIGPSLSNATPRSRVCLPTRC